jgi:hypothetical protein
MKHTTVEQARPRSPLGTKGALKIAMGWDGPPLRAVSLLGRPDVVLALPSMNSGRYWPFSQLNKRRLKKRLGNRPWQSQVLPEYMALTLDEIGSLRLLELERGSFILGKIKKELKQWPVADVKVAIATDSGWWRVVEISDKAGTYVVLSPFISRSQRASLKFIAQASGAGSRAD